MTKNICNQADKAIRIIAGLAIIGAGLYYQSWWGIIGIVPLATVALGWCPLYTILGIDTCKTEPRKA